MTNLQLAVQFFLQLAIILLVCRIVGQLAKYVGQPQVVAEMIAGVLLGPSLFGLLWPELQAALFPWDRMQQARDSQAYLFPASQLGLALYMFVVGMEFRTDLIRKNFKSSVAVSLAGMAAPFVLGAGLAYYFFHHRSCFLNARVSTKRCCSWAHRCASPRSLCSRRIIHFKGLAGSLMGTVCDRSGSDR